MLLAERGVLTNVVGTDVMAQRFVGDTPIAVDLLPLSGLGDGGVARCALVEHGSGDIPSSLRGALELPLPVSIAIAHSAEKLSGRDAIFTGLEVDGQR